MDYQDAKHTLFVFRSSLAVVVMCSVLLSSPAGKGNLALASVIPAAQSSGETSCGRLLTETDRHAEQFLEHALWHRIAGATGPDQIRIPELAGLLLDYAINCAGEVYNDNSIIASPRLQE